MKKDLGVTLVELLIVIALLTVVFSLTIINLTDIPASTALKSTYDLVLADLKSQQIKAMAGGADAYGGGASYGVHFETDSYTLFRGLVYTEGSPSNFEVSLEPTVEFSDSTFTNRAAVFASGSGEVAQTGQVVLTKTGGGEEKAIRLNKYGINY